MLRIAPQQRSTKQKSEDKKMEKHDFENLELVIA